MHGGDGGGGVCEVWGMMSAWMGWGREKAVWVCVRCGECMKGMGRGTSCVGGYDECMEGIGKGTSCVIGKFM